MIFMLQYQVDRDKQMDTQAFFESMSDEMIASEFPQGMKKIACWHDVANGTGWIVVDANDTEVLTAYTMQWSPQCTFPVVSPVVDDNTGCKLVKAFIASQEACVGQSIDQISQLLRQLIK